MLLSAHMIVKNGAKFDYPFIESCKSILPVCEELVVLEGFSDDDTYDQLVALQKSYPKIRIIREHWDKQHYKVLSEMTNKCIEACSGKYHLQIQADEILPEYFHTPLLEAVRREDFDYAVLGVLHFYGSFQTVYKPNVYYDSFVRLARKNSYPTLRSYDDAMSLGCPDTDPARLRKLNLENIKILHYGVVRKPIALIQKQTVMQEWWGYHDLDPFLDEGKKTGTINWDKKHDKSKLMPFKMPHPKYIRRWVREREDSVAQGRVDQ